MEKLIIIGGGPAGLSAAIYAARAGLSPLVIEGAPAGGQLTLTTEVENYPGFHEGILGPELIARFRKQAERFNTRFLTKNVVRLEFTDAGTRVLVGEDEFYDAQGLLIATGADAKWLNIPSEQRLRGKGVSACATCDGFFFKGKTVAVVGGGDTAMEEALTLTRFAKKVYIIHRRAEFRASAIMQDRVLKHPHIEVVWKATVAEILGRDKVEGVKLNMLDSSSTRELSAEGVFIAIGHKPATEFLKGSQVLLDDKGYVYTSGRVALENLQKDKKEELKQLIDKFNFDYQYMTSVPGVFAAGDCVDYVYRQAGTAVGMGIAAELELEKWLEEKASQ